MEITFTRGEGGTYSGTALRNDGVLLYISGSDRKFSLPHDVAHYVVEHGLGLTRGFWGRMAQGAIYPGTRVLAGRQPPHAAERSRRVMREEGPQGTEAEVLVGVLLTVMHENRDSDGPAVRALLNKEWRPNKPERRPPDTDEVKRICAALRDAERRWQRLEIGQSLTVTWRLDRQKGRRAAHPIAAVPR